MTVIDSRGLYGSYSLSRGIWQLLTVVGYMAVYDSRGLYGSY